jgi:hypothetical protein
MLGQHPGVYMCWFYHAVQIALIDAAFTKASNVVPMPPKGSGTNAPLPTGEHQPDLIAMPRH